MTVQSRGVTLHVNGTGGDKWTQKNGISLYPLISKLFINDPYPQEITKAMVLAGSPGRDRPILQSSSPQFLVEEFQLSTDCACLVPTDDPSLVGTIHVGDLVVSGESNEKDTVEAVGSDLKNSEMFIIPVYESEKTVEIELTFRSVDWPEGREGAAFPSQAFILPKDYNGPLPPTVESKKGWGEDHFQTIAPTETGRSTFKITMPTAHYKIIAEAGRMNRQTDAFDNISVDIGGSEIRLDPERPRFVPEILAIDGKTQARKIRGVQVEWQGIGGKWYNADGTTEDAKIVLECVEGEKFYLSFWKRASMLELRRYQFEWRKSFKSLAGAKEFLEKAMEIYLK